MILFKGMHKFASSTWIFSFFFSYDFHFSPKSCKGLRGFCPHSLLAFSYLFIYKYSFSSGWEGPNFVNYGTVFAGDLLCTGSETHNWVHSELDSMTRSEGAFRVLSNIFSFVIWQWSERSSSFCSSDLVSDLHIWFLATVTFGTFMNEIP